MAPQILRLGPPSSAIPKFSRLEHLAKFAAHKSDGMRATVASVDYHDARMARGSQINDPHALQPIRFQHTPGPHLLPGGARPFVGPGM
jgi:hypothetical protein